MISKKVGAVKEILKETSDIEEIIVMLEDGSECKAYNYPKMNGNLSVEDEVLLNTTAVELSLGTGGYHFVIANLNNMESELTPGGHIMKLRYTPMQLKVDAVEEQGSEYHDKINNFKSLDGMSVVVGGLHSMLKPFACMLKKDSLDKKLVYIMTDGASLPIYLSQDVSSLKEKGLVDHTITVGNAFGGDYECVNIYTALMTAKEVLNADCIFISMGPGIAGTGTKYGFTGIEQGPILDAVHKLGGMPVFIPRVSFGDKRDRHIGISHHTLTVLKEIVNVPVNVVFNIVDEEKELRIKEQVREHGLAEKHRVVYLKNNDTFDALSAFGMKVKTMGRGYEQDKEFFDCAGGAGALV